MSKTVTSAGHNKERIGAFVTEGEVENEQPADTALSLATESSAAQRDVQAVPGSAIPKSQNDNADDSASVVSPGSGAEAQQVNQGSDAESEGKATGVMSFVNRHLPIWRSVVALRQQIQAQQRQIDTLNALAQQLRHRERLLGNSAHDQARMDGWYQDLQDLHRGSQESLAEGQRAYIHHFNDRAADLQLAGPIFDLGCGRGEWLALMAAEGWAVRGVDSSEVAVAEAHAQGLDVELGDLVEALEACPESALAGVTAFQVVEHLPFSRITALMHAAFRALVPGGILLLETPNPENLQVATYGFWMDPTHRHPIPPPLIMDLSFHVGFRDGSILRKNPWPQWQEAKVDSSLESEVGYRLFGPQDYALLVYKPATAD